MNLSNMSVTSFILDAEIISHVLDEFVIGPRKKR
jgi:hypothetical protein